MGLALTSRGQDQVLLSQTRQRQALDREHRVDKLYPKNALETNKKRASICVCIEDQNMDYYRGARTTDYYNLRVDIKVNVHNEQCPLRRFAKSVVVSITEK